MNHQQLFELLCRLGCPLSSKDHAMMLPVYHVSLSIGWWCFGPAELLLAPKTTHSPHYWHILLTVNYNQILDGTTAHLIPLKFRQIRSRWLGDWHVCMRIYNASNKKQENPWNQHQRFPKQGKAVELVVDLQNRQ